MFKIQYQQSVVEKDIRKLPKTIKERIKSAIETKLMEQPEVYGKPLRRSLKGYRKLRVGDYRIIFRIENDKVKIFIIQHRSVVYKKSKIRLI